MKTKFIVVDDDATNNILCRIMIKRVYPDASIKTYTDPEMALNYIKLMHSNNNIPDTVLFLDINMPTLTGWEFLEVFDMFEESIKEQLMIYMLSSSVNPSDMQRALDNHNVHNYFEKPLTLTTVEMVANE